MKIKIYAIGKIKDFYKLGCDEYIKRLSSYVQVEVIELKDEPIPDKPSESEILKAKKLEGNRIEVFYKDGVRAVTPGQAVVLYDGEVCLGGAIIDSVYMNEERRKY